MTGDHEGLRGRDYLLLGALAFALFGYTMVSGRPLTMHEARLPQLAREMAAGADRLLPTSGGRPWLERPPLPHWCILAADRAFGRGDCVAVARLPSVLAGVFTVLVTGWMASRLFGRTIALLSGIVLATTYEFYAYATLAEDDVFVAALVAGAMALFVHTEFHPDENIRSSHGWLSRRPWPVLGFFVLLGLSNLAKGPLVGMSQIVVAVGGFLLWSADRRGARRLAWLWGWLICLVVSVAWPLWAYRRYPDVLDNWLYDYAGTRGYDQPIWYYFVALLVATAPWTLAMLIGLASAAGSARRDWSRAHRLILSWAVCVLVLLSIPHRKHHHYLVPVMVPWAMLAAIGLRRIGEWLRRESIPLWLRSPVRGVLFVGVPGAAALWLFRERIPGPTGLTAALAVVWVVVVACFYAGWRVRRGGVMLGAIVAGLAAGYSWSQSYPAANSAGTPELMRFIRQVRATVPPDRQLFINGQMGLNFFRLQFYLRPDAALLQNLTFLRDEKITAPEVYVIARGEDGTLLEALGSMEVVVRSEVPPSPKAHPDPFILVRLRFDPWLSRYPAPKDVSVMQAMGRKPGPFCGSE